eukprot:9483021-Pyramimonas_sp.AAC.1
MLQVSGDADEEDLATFNSAMAASSDVKIKEEPETETMKMAKRVEELRAGVQDKLRVYHDMHVDAKVIKTKIGASSDNGKYSETFVKDLDKHIAKLARATKILDRMCTEEVNDTELPKLINTLDAIDKEDVSIKEWAVRFNAYTPKPTGEGGNKRRRTKRDRREFCTSVSLLGEESCSEAQLQSRFLLSWLGAGRSLAAVRLPAGAKRTELSTLSASIVQALFKHCLGTRRATKTLVQALFRYRSQQLQPVQETLSANAV